MTRPLTPGSPPPLRAADSSADPLQDLEIRLLLQGVYERYGYDFRDYALASRRRRIRQCLRDENLPTVSALQARVLHDPAAGTARDWDVFLASVVAWKPSKTTHRPALNFLLGYASAEREEAQAGVADLVKTQQHFDAFSREVIEAVHKSRRPRTKVLLDLAQPMFHELFQLLNAALQGNPQDYEQLHQVRIHGKRLRYAMEVFGGCFPASFRDELYPQVEAVQELLGELNDHRVAVSRLESLHRALPRMLEEVCKRLTAGIDEQQPAPAPEGAPTAPGAPDGPVPAGQITIDENNQLKTEAPAGEQKPEAAPESKPEAKREADTKPAGDQKKQ